MGHPMVIHAAVFEDCLGFPDPGSRMMHPPFSRLEDPLNSSATRLPFFNRETRTRGFASPDFAGFAIFGANSCS